MPIITGIDILGIQKYVFASNRLRDVISASWMVEHVTSRGTLAQWGLAADRVRGNAGGNAIVRFDSLDAAKKWTGQYTRWLQDTAPGLEAVVAHQLYGEKSLAWGIKALQISLARQKLERVPAAPQLGLSVTASCSITRFPATDLDHGDLVSPRVKHLREKVSEARQGWEEYLPKQLADVPNWRVEFPPEFDQLGRSRGETSLLGVVHVDGNSVGRSIQKWLDRCIDDELGNDAVWERLSEWSEAIDKLGKAVLRTIVNRAVECIHAEDGEMRAFACGTPHELGFALYGEGGKTAFLPLQPILLGGDDLTFVCDGRIALDLAVTALREFGKHGIPHLGENGGDQTLTACAGVALAKVRAPFHRSYEQAEALCQSAKRRRQEMNQTNETGCWLDWHVGMTRPGDSVKDIRERQYKHGSLTMRPYPLVEFGDRSQSWEWLDEALLGPRKTPDYSFRGFDAWSGSRNRVKRLGSLVADGPDEVKRQIEAWRVTEKNLRIPGGLPESGFIDSKTPLLDAVELMDLHLRLEPDPTLTPKGED